MGMRRKFLLKLLTLAVVVLILRVLVSILANYPDYFPPNFDSLFLQGRERTFFGVYRVAFYIHIISAPFVLLNGLYLISVFSRRQRFKYHRLLGWIQVILMLGLFLPSSIVMSQQAFAGWLAGLSFFVLSGVTAFCLVVGVVYASRKKFHSHAIWMTRTYVLMCSAISLRLISGAVSLLGVTHAETAYILAAWSSWLIPLGVHEIILRVPEFRHANHPTQP